MMELNLVKDKTTYDSAANSNAPSRYVNHITKAIKELVDHWEVKVDIGVAEYSYFVSVPYEKVL